MLDSINLNDKTYQELLLEAIAQIPLYSKEWTNYNISDPGITILQNLTAFQLAQTGNFLIYCREKPGEPYRAYSQLPMEGMQGRFWSREEIPQGVRIRFPGGYQPCEDEDAVRVVCYDNEIIHHRLLGRVEGYDDQTLRLGQVKGVLPESLLLTVVTDEGACFFVASGEEGPDGFRYRFRGGAEQIVIQEPGRGGYALYLSGCAVTPGRTGQSAPLHPAGAAGRL